MTPEGIGSSNLMPDVFPVRGRDACLALMAAAVFTCAVIARQPAQPAVPPAAQPATPGQPTGSKPTPGAEPEVPVKAGKEEAEYRVKLKSGAEFDGILNVDAETTDDRFVVLVVAGVETSFARKDIESLTKLPSVEERYAEMRAAIDPTDADKLISLAEWLRARKRFDLASKDIEAALKLEPANKKAQDLKLLIEQQSLLEQSSGTGKPRKERPSKEPRTKFPTLSEEQTNLMKVYEIDLKDPGRIVIGHELIEQLINRFGDNLAMPSSREGKEALYRASPEKLLDLMFRVQARELYSKVKIVDAPRSLRLFRENVHRTWLLNSCATTACHGGEAAGRFRLNPERGTTDATVLTNMYILDRFRLKDGKTLINYEAPADSPLLQYGLPPEQAKLPHPDITAAGRRKHDLKPAFRDLDDSRFQQSVEWIRSLYKPRPNYMFNLGLPGLDEGPRDNAPAKSQPSTGPALGNTPPKTGDKATDPKSPKPAPTTPPAAKPEDPLFPK